MKNNASISFFSSFLRACFDSALLSTEGILHLSRILMSKPYAWLVSASDISEWQRNVFSFGADKTAPNSADFIKRKLRGSPLCLMVMLTAPSAVIASN